MLGGYLRRVNMDGFKNRLSGRYDRSDKSSNREGRYERSGDSRYDRLTKRADSITIEAISDVIEKSNRTQLGLISNLIKENRIYAPKATASDADNKDAKETGVAVRSTRDSEILERLERMAGQTCESMNENEEVIQKSYEILRAQTDMLIGMGGNIDSVCKAVSSTENEEKLLEVVEGNRTLLNIIRQELHSSDEEVGEGVSVPLDSKMAEKKFDALTDHVHIQCVKTFRNVQANLNDQTSEIVKQLKASNHNLLVFSIGSLCLNLVTLALIVCEILKVFG